MSEYIVGWMGFPVIIEDPVFRMILGEEVLDVDPSVVEKKVCEALVFKPSKMTGKEVRFLRHHMLMTQGDLAKALVQANHSIVSQWEAKGSQVALMNVGTEMFLRLLVARRVLGQGVLEQAIGRLPGMKLQDDEVAIRVRLFGGRQAIADQAFWNVFNLSNQVVRIVNWKCQQNSDLGLGGAVVTCQPAVTQQTVWDVTPPGEEYVSNAA